MNNYRRIRYKNIDYAVIGIKYNSIDLPIVLDWKDYNKIKKYDFKWRYVNRGYVSCTYRKNDAIKELLMHDLIMTLINKDNEDAPQNKPIIHVNRIGLDNRRINLTYNNKNINNNINKKKRIVKLPVSCNIEPNDIPTYIWYIKEDATHGDRFMVDINGCKWKTTSSKQYSTRYKLEEAKAYLRELKKRDPQIFKNMSMNGDYNKHGEELANSYYDIIYLAGYTKIKRAVCNSNTDTLLKPCNLTNKEKQLINNTMHDIFDATESSEYDDASTDYSEESN